MYRFFLKPFLDFITALAGFILLLPIFLLLTFLLSFRFQGAPFFIQKRPGKHGKIFSIIKFKTMTEARDGWGELLPDDQRSTAIGKFIRATSLDEIPQLLNVIIGNMSMVGPRPLLPEYLPLYTSFQKRRHRVKPGITGYAQVNGRNAISWEQKFELDVYYVEHQSFLLDLSILLKTVKKVFLRSDVNTNPNMTMSRFKGTKTE
ncbi:sugar transferase [Jejudonia soesokkakensis]|uniref:Sugar transferase n=1 Tax=Jejudonia soesokkakensis TaxID=1323432 RepID=A0ABW2MR98_9FLAO